ncbi:MAG: 3-hydroxybutyryl-CoA dehydrogenase [Clostridia bacterium]|jgi:3-hydroxybutyryl-CoA dehydrogenase|nr:3-hydroxybutyryl-CoA dehydrogenase [Clostridia bacterium]MDH7572372.1 3-hydroxybutyryl-CoA dehydrogenase [Clostridia bacterium]
MEVKKILVVGAGQMGAGIAQVAAQAGLEVVVNDVADEFLERGLRIIDQNLERNVAKGKLTAEEKAAVMGRIRTSLDLAAGADADLAIEAVIENLETKKRVFQNLDAVLSSEAILASNTSSLSITQLAAFTKNPARVVGMHFFNPVPVMQLVEVISGLATNPAVVETAMETCRRVGKTPVLIKDSPGFAVNRLLIPMLNEAIYAVYEGVGSPEDIDTVMKLGANHPMGPLALADLIGLDTVLAIMEVLYQNFGDPKYRPCPLLRQYVQAGWLGRKTGRGFYQY